MWQELLVVFGGNATLLVVLAYLCKSLLSQRLLKDAERFKTQLKSDADVELERFKAQIKADAEMTLEHLKSTLQMAALEHEVRFSKLHEKRGEVIDELYTGLVDAINAASRFVHVEAFDAEKRMDEGTAAETKYWEFHDLVMRRRIYLHESTCKLLVNILNKVRSAFVKAKVYAPIEGEEENNEARKEALLTAVKAFSDEIPEGQRALEKEFRSLLGVENTNRSNI